MIDPHPLVGDAAAFPSLNHVHWFNHAGVAPLPSAVRDAMVDWADAAQQNAYLAKPSPYKRLEQIRKTAARLINADTDDIAFIKNTSEGLSHVAFGLDWNPGDAVLVADREYPSNLYPWMALERHHDVRLIHVRETPDEHGVRRVPIDHVLDHISRSRENGLRLVALSHVQFGTGQRLDVARIGAACREHGVPFCVDAIQSVGVLPVDVRQMHIDFLSADGHKWMLGPEGAGVLYVRRELAERMRPALVGWLSTINPFDYDTIDYTLPPNARRFECGTHPVATIIGLGAALDLLTSVGIVNVAARAKALTDRIVAGVAPLGFTVASPRAADEWSGSVSFLKEGTDAAAVQVALRQEHGIEVAARAGRLRASPHFYNTDDQIDELIERLGRVISS